MKKSKPIRIFITGGTGFLGSNLIHHLIKSDNIYKITALTRDKTKINKFHKLNNEKIKWIEEDILNLRPKSTKYDYFIHMACPSAEETFRGIDNLTKFSSIVEGTRNALEFAKKTKVKKFIFTSSGSVYGDYKNKYKFVPESYIPNLDITNHNITHGLSKTVAEYLCLNYSNKNFFETCILRCFSFVGRNIPLNLHYAIGNFILEAINSQKITIKGPAQTFRSYLNVADFCEWMEVMLLKKQKCKIYNLGSENYISMHNLAKKIRYVTNKNIIIKCENKKNSVGNLYRKYYMPDISLIKNEFNLIEKKSLEESIEEILDYNKF